MIFPLRSGGTYQLPEHYHRMLIEGHPRLNVPSELEKALAWVVMHPSRRKTAGGMPRYLRRWMARALAELPPPPPPRKVVIGQNADGSPRYG